jgi:hypothetical protein
MTIMDVQNAATYGANHWHAIVAYSAGGLGISILLQWLKRHFKLDEKTFAKLDGPRIIAVILSILTSLGTLVNYLIDPVTAQNIPKEFTFLLTAAFFIHRFMVSPVGAKLEKTLKPYWQALEQIKSTEERTMTTAADPVVPTVSEPFTLPQFPGLSQMGGK